MTTRTTQESVVKEIATPRGWYRTYDRFVSGDGVSVELQASLGQSFDVVHCMSGGFLNLALVLSSKIPAKFKVLVLDSTPIMPQPKAFVRFARAYMSDHGLDFITKLLPERFHTWIYTSRWGIGGAYVRAKHKVTLCPCQAQGCHPPPGLSILGVSRWLVSRRLSRRLH